MVCRIVDFHHQPFKLLERRPGWLHMPWWTCQLAMVSSALHIYIYFDNQSFESTSTSHSTAWLDHTAATFWTFNLAVPMVASCSSSFLSITSLSQWCKLLRRSRTVCLCTKSERESGNVREIRRWAGNCFWLFGIRNSLREIRVCKAFCELASASTEYNKP